MEILTHRGTNKINTNGTAYGVEKKIPAQFQNGKTAHGTVCTRLIESLLCAPR